MGSAKTPSTKAQPTNELITRSNSIVNSLKALFNKGLKRKTKNKPLNELDVPIKNDDTPKPVVMTPVKNLLENLNKLNISADKEETDDEDEIKNNFTIKVVDRKEEGRIERYASNSSEDSGFVETGKSVDVKTREEDFAESLSRLKIEEKKVKDNKDDGKKKEKRLQTVYIPRAPTRSTVVPNRSHHPYQQVCLSFLRIRAVCW